MKTIKYLLFVGLLSDLLSACNSEKTASASTQKITTQPVRVIAIGRVEPETKITSVGSEVNGVIQKIYVHAGDSVKKNQLLLEFRHEYEDAKLVQANSKTAAQNAEIKNVQAQINSAKIKLANLKTRYERTERMFENAA
jgi:multidrug efflux pump subunit AcrA (membrane-fusion protein)